MIRKPKYTTGSACETPFSHSNRIACLRYVPLLKVDLMSIDALPNTPAHRCLTHSTQDKGHNIQHEIGENKTTDTRKFTGRTCSCGYQVLKSYCVVSGWPQHQRTVSIGGGEVRMGNTTNSPSQAASPRTSGSLRKQQIPSYRIVVYEAGRAPLHTCVVYTSKNNGRKLEDETT